MESNEDERRDLGTSLPSGNSVDGLPLACCTDAVEGTKSGPQQNNARTRPGAYHVGLFVGG